MVMSLVRNAPKVGSYHGNKQHCNIANTKNMMNVCASKTTLRLHKLEQCKSLASEFTGMTGSDIEIFINISLSKADVHVEYFMLSHKKFLSTNNNEATRRRRLAH